MMHWLQTHGADALALYALYSALVSGMPEPTSASGTGYVWLYHSLHVLAGDLSYLLGSHVQKP